MVEIDLSDELIDLIVKDALASALGFAAIKVALSHLSQVGCVRRAWARLLHSSLFHIVSLLGKSDLGCPLRNFPLVGGGCQSPPDTDGCDSDVCARLYKRIAGYGAIFGWRRSLSRFRFILQNR